MTTVKNANENGRWLSDGKSSLWVNRDGMVKYLSMFVLSDVPEKMLTSMAESFDTDKFSGLHWQFWEYETEKEWDRVWQKIHGESQAEFYIEMMNLIRGKPHNIMADTNGMVKADIAKRLIAANPVLAFPEHKSVLMKKMNNIYHNDYAKKFNLTEQDVATLLFMLRHDDVGPYLLA